MSHLKSILLRKMAKNRNSDSYHSSGTLTQKFIEWFRLQINDRFHITKTSHWNGIKVGTLDQSKSYTPSYQSLSLESTENVREQSSPDETKQKYSDLSMSRFSSEKLGNIIMKYIHIYNYYWPKIFILFNINSAILCKCAKYIVPFLNCLQLKAKCSFFYSKVLTKIFVPLTNWSFFTNWFSPTASC